MTRATGLGGPASAPRGHGWRGSGRGARSRQNPLWADAQPRAKLPCTQVGEQAAGPGGRWGCGLSVTKEIVGAGSRGLTPTPKPFPETPPHLVLTCTGLPLHTTCLVFGDPHTLPEGSRGSLTPGPELGDGMSSPWHHSVPGLCLQMYLLPATHRLRNLRSMNAFSPFLFPAQRSGPSTSPWPDGPSHSHGFPAALTWPSQKGSQRWLPSGLRRDAHACPPRSYGSHLDRPRALPGRLPHPQGRAGPRRPTEACGRDRTGLGPAPRPPGEPRAG